MKFRIIFQKDANVSGSKNLFWLYFYLTAFLISEQVLEFTQNFPAVNINFDGFSKILFETKKKTFFSNK